VTRGYGVWASSGLTGTTTVLYQNELNSGDKSASLTYNDNPGEGHGWNMIGNPYPSGIDWNANWTANNVDATGYLWNGIQYLTWNRLTQLGTAPSSEIPVTQGFFVKANGPNPTLTIPQSERIHSVQNFYKKSSDNVIKLKAAGNGYSDMTIIGFSPNASPDFDNDFDGYKLGNIIECPELFTYAQNTELAVNVLDIWNEDLVIPVGFRAGVPEKYIISIDPDSNIPDAWKLYLTDLKENRTVFLKSNKPYGFNADPADDPDRFVLRFKKINENAFFQVPESLVYNMQANENGLNLQFSDPYSGVINVYTITGQLVRQYNANNEMVIKMNGLRSNTLYMVSLTGSNATDTQKIFIK